MKPFPADFLWGTSQSGHQIEGQNFNSDWWRWEQRPGRIADGSISKEAAGHMDRFEQDFDLAKDLGHNAHFFSLEWARIQPSPGEFDDEAIEHYRRVFEALRVRRLEPICALQHVTVPGWFADRFGWHSNAAPDLFQAYAERVAREFSPHCRRWIPIREPMHWCTMAYLERAWPPASRLLNLARARRALMNMAHAHARAYRALHQASTSALVGTAVHARLFTPLDSESAWDVRTERREQRRCNHLWLNALTTGRWPSQMGRAGEIKDTLDFIGVAYYGSETVRFSLLRPGQIFAQRTGPEGQPQRRLRYAADPEGFCSVLHEMARYGRPIIVTANGIATDDDEHRCRYLVEHINALRVALDGGVDIRGYCFRSLLDGFEWDAGYSARFGLVHVDRKSLTRTPNPSALLYKKLCETGTISPGNIAKYRPEPTESTQGIAAS